MGVQVAQPPTCGPPDERLRAPGVAYRLALDHAERVGHLAVLDIVPTLDAWDLADARFAEGYWPCRTRPPDVYASSSAQGSSRALMAWRWSMAR
ncbi:MAG TPA: hypothetical protein VE888_24600 [Streptosporangiaceae bacterium]|nr:hypothetical protein [Streptosporangiaceae bacterium]